jgi:hypothetical protein
MGTFETRSTGYGGGIGLIPKLTRRIPRSMSDEIVLRLGEPTAHARSTVLYMDGGHFAVRGTHRAATREADVKLSAFLRDLDIALGGTGRGA